MIDEVGVYGLVRSDSDMSFCATVQKAFNDGGTRYLNHMNGCSAAGAYKLPPLHASYCIGYSAIKSIFTGQTIFL